jgi:hypothetical protein
MRTHSDNKPIVKPELVSLIMILEEVPDLLVTATVDHNFPDILTIRPLHDHLRRRQ